MGLEARLRVNVLRFIPHDVLDVRGSENQTKKGVLDTQRPEAAAMEISVGYVRSLFQEQDCCLASVNVFLYL